MVLPRSPPYILWPESSRRPRVALGRFRQAIRQAIRSSNNMERGHEQSDDAGVELKTETTELLKLPTFSRMSKLQLLRHPLFTSPSPPWDARASVPFHWEEVPGKRKSFHARSPEPCPCAYSKLPPPPRLFGANMGNVGFVRSPTAVLHRMYTDRSLPFSSSFSGECRCSCCGSSQVVGAGDADFCSHGGSGGEDGLELSGKVRITRTRRSWRLSHLLKDRSHSWGSITRGFRKVVLRKSTQRHMTLQPHPKVSLIKNYESQVPCIMSLSDETYQ